MQSPLKQTISSTDRNNLYQRASEVYEDARQDYRTACRLWYATFIVIAVLLIVGIIGMLVGFFHVANSITQGAITTFLGFLPGALIPMASRNRSMHLRRMEDSRKILDAIQERDSLRILRDSASHKAAREEIDRRLNYLVDLIYASFDKNRDTALPLQKQASEKREEHEKHEELGGQTQASTDYKDGYGGIS